MESKSEIPHICEVFLCVHTYRIILVTKFEFGGSAMKYSDVFLRLTYETAAIVFIKKDGTVRTLLGTRNMKTASMSGEDLIGKIQGYDSRFNISNGNMAVVDLIIGDVRAFNIDRLVFVEWLGEIESREGLNEAYKLFEEFDNEYSKKRNKYLTMDMLV